MPVDRAIRVRIGIRVGVSGRACAGAPWTDLTLGRSTQLNAPFSITLNTPWSTWNARRLLLGEADSIWRNEKKGYAEDESPAHGSIECLANR